MAFRTLRDFCVPAQGRLLWFLFAGVIAAQAGAATVTRETLEAWNKAVARATAEVSAASCDPDHLLWMDRQEHATKGVEAGKVIAQHAQRDDMTPVPSGLLHHWRGGVLVRDASVADVLSVLQDYNSYAEIFGPAVIQSRLLNRRGDDFEYRLKFLQRGFGITAGLEADLHSRYIKVDSKSGYTLTWATNLVELNDAGVPGERALSQDEAHGFVEKLFTIVRYRQSEAGVYLEVETLSLSRDVPAAIRWVTAPVIQRFSRQVMTETLQKIREHVTENQSLALATQSGRAVRIAR